MVIISVSPSHTERPHINLWRVALWFRTAMNREGSTGPLTLPFTRSLIPLTHLLDLLCSLCITHCACARSAALIQLLARSLTHSRACAKVNENDLILTHSVLAIALEVIYQPYACAFMYNAIALVAFISLYTL